MLQALFDVILPVFAVIGSGFVLTRAGFFNEAHIEGLMRFTQGFAIPCLLFRAIAETDLARTFDPALLAAFYLGALVAFAVGIFGSRLLFGRDWQDCVVIGFACLFSNSLLLGLPITERAFGPDALTGNYAIVSLHAPVCYGLGITVMEIVRNAGKAGPQLLVAVFSAMFRNVLILGIILGFLVNMSNVPIPGVVDDGLDLITRAALPCALFALGGVLVQYRPEGDLRVIAFVGSVSLLMLPAVVWLAGRAFDLPQDFFRSAVLTAAMAPGFNAYIFANMYDRAKRVAASSVLVLTGTSILTTWWWLAALQ